MSKETKETIKTNTVEWSIKEARVKNPYPKDIFTGETQDGKIGRHCHDVWNNALDEFVKILNRKIEEEGEK